MTRIPELLAATGALAAAAWAWHPDPGWQFPAFACAAVAGRLLVELWRRGTPPDGEGGS